MKSVNQRLLEKKINGVMEKQGADSSPLDILLAYVNGELSYWSALHNLGQIKMRISDIQTILIEELHPQIKESKENSYFVKELLEQME